MVDSNVVNIDAARPHVVVITRDNKAHVLSAWELRKFAKNETSINYINDMVLRRIVEEWLNALENKEEE